MTGGSRRIAYDIDHPPSIRGIAQAAGVSKTTVSLALRDHPRIRPAVRRRIQRIASEAGYRPNAVMANLLAQLRASKVSAFQSTLGLLCGAEDRSILHTPTVQAWIAGCRARAGEQGYGFDEFWLYEADVSPARLVQILDTRNIRGLVVVGWHKGETVPRKFGSLWRRSSPVAIGARPFCPSVHFVSNDQYVTIVQAVREVMRLGYRRPGLCISAHVDDIVEKKFSAGFWAATETFSIETKLPMFDVHPHVKKGFLRWLELHRPDVILTIHAEIEEWITDLGLDVPGEIGLVHLDKSHRFDAWAGMQQNSEAIGRSAIDMVIGQLHRNESGVPSFQRCMLINSTWVPGGTVRLQQAGPGARKKPSPVRARTAPWPI